MKIINLLSIALITLLSFVNGENTATEEENIAVEGECIAANKLLGKDLNGNCCLEKEITCEKGYIVKLSIHDMNLGGTIPSEIGNLSHLKELFLYNIQLSGSIPPEIGNLSQLTTLSLHHNNLSGSIPIEIFKLSQLEVLSLHHNSLSGSIPSEIGNLHVLKSLYLEYNILSGSIPSEIENLNQLEVIYLSYNQLTGSIPSGIGKLTHMQKIHLENNNLSGQIPNEIGNLIHLEDLSLFKNELSGPIPSEIGNLKYLKELNLYHNNFCGNIPVLPNDCAVKIDIDSECTDRSISKGSDTNSQGKKINITEIILIIVGVVVVILLGILVLYFRKKANNKKEKKFEGPSEIINIYPSNKNDSDVTFDKVTITTNNEKADISEISNVNLPIATLNNEVKDEKLSDDFKNLIDKKTNDISKESNEEHSTYSTVPFSNINNEYIPSAPCESIVFSSSRNNDNTYIGQNTDSKIAKENEYYNGDNNNKNKSKSNEELPPTYNDVVNEIITERNQYMYSSSSTSGVQQNNLHSEKEYNH